MAAKSEPSAMVIRDVTPGVTTLSLPFKLLGSVKVGARATIIRLQTGSLAVFSPVPLTTDVKEKIQSLGEVRYIAALNREHHIFISPWANEYPNAEVIGMEGLPEKREKREDTKGVKFAHVFTTENKAQQRISPEFDSEFEYEYVNSHQNGELVFMHKPTGTLIQADLIFNLPATEQYSKSKESADSGFLNMVVSGLLHTKGDLIWQKRNLFHVSGSKDRAGFAESLKKMQQWNFDRVIPCHGDVIENGGKEVLNQLSEWFIEGKK